MYRTVRREPVLKLLVITPRVFNAILVAEGFSAKGSSKVLKERWLTGRGEGCVWALGGSTACLLPVLRLVSESL